MQMRLLLAGATGLVGSCALEQALCDETFEEVVAFTRRPLPPRQKLVNQVVDFCCPPLDSSLWQADAAISMLGTTARQAGSSAEFYRVDHEYALRFAQIAQCNGVERFALVSSVGANVNSAINYLKVKGEIERDIRRLPFSSLTIARPSILAGKRESSRGHEQLVASLLYRVGPALPAWLRVSPAENVAAALISGVKRGKLGSQIVFSDSFPVVKE